MMNFDIADLNWEKMNGLIPAIVQDAKTNTVLMLGYMNREALEKTLTSSLVTFFSRRKNQLWVKGETSGNQLKLVDISADCDKDTLLILANPIGPVCHTGQTTCFEKNENAWQFIQDLEKIIQSRQQSQSANSYVATLFSAGISRMAQKVGEEAVEVALAAVDKNEHVFCEEAADLWFHLLVLLQAKGFSFNDIVQVLKRRYDKSLNENAAEN